MINDRQAVRKIQQIQSAHLSIYFSYDLFISIYKITWERHFEIASKLRVKTIKIRLINLPVR